MSNEPTNFNNKPFSQNLQDQYSQSQHEQYVQNQQQQYEKWQQEEKSKSKKAWLWGCSGCAGCLVLLIILAVILTTFAGAVLKKVEEDSKIKDTTVQKLPNIQNDTQNKDNSQTGDANETPNFDFNKKKPVNTDKDKALEQAKICADGLYMSRSAIYDQLRSPYGDHFSDEAAQYAIDQINPDYKQNALKRSEIYVNDMNMSKDQLYDQLTSKFGDQFTEEEAQYAVDNINK